MEYLNRLLAMRDAGKTPSAGFYLTNKERVAIGWAISRIAELEKEQGEAFLMIASKQLRIDEMEQELTVLNSTDEYLSANVVPKLQGRIAELEAERGWTWTPEELVRHLDAGTFKQRERIAVLEGLIKDWLEYEADSSDCPNCEGCKDSEPGDMCIFKTAADLLGWRDE